MRRVYGAILDMAWQAAPGRLTAVVALSSVVALATTAEGLVTKLVVDALVAGDRGTAFVAGAAFLGLAGLARLGETGGGLLQNDLAERAGQEVERRLMTVAALVPGLEHLERPEFADKVKLVRDRSYIAYFAFNNLAGSVVVVLGLVASVALLASVHPLLVLVPAVALPAGSLEFGAWRRQFARHDRTAPEERLARHLLELTTQPAAAKEVRLFGLGPHLVDRFSEVTSRYVSALLRGQVRRATVGAASAGLYGATIATAIAFVGWLALRGRASLGDVALAVQATRTALGHVTTATRNVAWLAETAFVGERYLWLLDYRSPVRALPPGEARPAPDVVRHGISVENVTLVYPGTEHPVLRDVSLFLPAGATVALVGENGAGKSSLVKLLCRFYDPTEGRILVDGVDLRDIDLAGWRERVAAAFQDFVRFQLVARESVGVGQLQALDDLERVGASARGAGADSVIERLPQGFETQLGRWFEGGVDLSEGEWQRLALARGLMRPAPALVVLDEPTANLDARAEHEVFERFSAMARPVGRAWPLTLLVSHRFSTVRMADHIVVLHRGRVDEQGSHDELVAAGGRYAQLFRLQASRYAEDS